MTGQPMPMVTDFARSYCYYVPAGYTIWVRIQAECWCRVIDAASGEADDYVLGVRTQTGLRTDPIDDALDPGYDFWMTFSARHVYVRRTHASAHTNNPTRVPVEEFVSTGWVLRPAPARQLKSAADILRALQAGERPVARTSFFNHDRSREYCIEYPIKWADGDPVKGAFRVETGPVLLLDPEQVRAGAPVAFDDFRWAYLDYHDFGQVRCLIERPTSVLTGSTYPASSETPRRHPPLTPDQRAALERYLFDADRLPIPPALLARLLETDHYSEIAHFPVETTIFALTDNALPNT